MTEDRRHVLEHEPCGGRHFRPDAIAGQQRYSSVHAALDLTTEGTTCAHTKCGAYRESERQAMP